MFEIGPQDETKHRVLEMDNGNKLHFKSSDPFGFWKINLDKGQLPEYLQGQYTTYTEAEKAAQAWLRDKGREAVKPKV